MPRYFLLVLVLLLAIYSYSADRASISSPNGKIRVELHSRDRLYYAIWFGQTQLVVESPIALILDRPAELYGKFTVSTRSNRSEIVSPVPEKRKIIPDNYNELTLQFRNSIRVVVRVYDDGMAYRFVTSFNDSIIVRSELATVNFPMQSQIWFPEVVKRDNVDIYHTSFEEPYQYRRVDSLFDKNLCFTPVLVDVQNIAKLIVTESDLEDYPGMFIKGNGTGGIVGDFAPYPLAEKINEGEFPQAVVAKRADYIARTIGKRSFPWRVFMIAATDKELPGNDLVYRLASPSRIDDPSWIKPGKGTDEWIIGVNLFNIPFKSGVNTATYKYYIDFAKRFGFDRIMMDAGWSDNSDLFRINPNIDMNEIAAYAKQQNVRLSMWTLALTLSRQLEPALEQFNKWGVDFIMTDFMDRDDQEMVKFYYRIAEACAKHKIMIMYHGAFKPAGFGRTFPNAVTREGVLGSEYNIWSDKPTPEHNLLLPFIRMTAGPMDYEPGILDNATAKTFRPIGDKVMSIGTRCHQAAMFIVYESPIQLFSGNPSQGLLEPAFMDLIGSIPTVWDTTIVVDGKVGDYIITARKKGDDWFVGAMTDWTQRDLNLDLSFLSNGKYKATICGDGINADRYASDYKMEEKVVDRSETLSIKLAPGGGWLMRLKKIK